MDEHNNHSTIISPPPLIRITIEKDRADKLEYCFTESFIIGRGNKCDIRLLDDTVSRSHAEVRFESGEWSIRDLQSGNGILLNGQAVESTTLGPQTKIEFGPDGPILLFVVESKQQPEESQVDDLSLTHYKEHYFGDSTEGNIGQHTMMVRQAFEYMQKSQRKKYIWIIAFFVCMFLSVGGYAILKHRESKKQKIIAEEIFYTIKSMELEFADILEAARISKDAQSKRNVEKYKTKRKEMEKKYDQFLDTLNVYGKNLSKEERLILKMARVFGECEINIPEDFTKEVHAYIKKWKSTNRLENAIKKAKKKGYIPKVVKTMADHDLPPQFFYLALQESNFNVNAIGPETRFGIAKGAWQFIPSTAKKYGLRTGGMADVREVDPRDERHHFGRSTLAAARYLRFIYDTEAQASGLLVIASYNWGERRVIRLLKTMPKNPKERNFWRILKDNKKRIPKQTYDYVFYIFSAAVIGEDPRLFGFNFDNPLAEVTTGKKGL